MGAFTVVQGALALGALRRLARGKARRGPLEPLAGPAGATVVIPARDEAERLPVLLRALAADPGVERVVVVDDRSSDATAAVAREHGAEVLAGTDPPVGWAGKPWALQQALAAECTKVPGTFVHFDADVVPGAGLVAALAREVAEHGPEVLVTATVRFGLDDPVARALHGSFLAGLVLRHGPQDVDGPPPPAHRATANGQVMALDAGALQAVGGFWPVAGNLTEDIALARFLAARGWTVRTVDASALAEVRPYATATEVWSSWGRSLMAPDATSAPDQLLDLATIWAVQALPLPRLLLGRGTRLDLALLGLRGLLLLALKDAYRPRGAAHWLAPLLDLPGAVRLTASVLRPTRTWRGRSY